MAGAWAQAAATCSIIATRKRLQIIVLSLRVEISYFRKDKEIANNHDKKPMTRKQLPSTSCGFSGRHTGLPLLVPDPWYRRHAWRLSTYHL